MPFKSYVALSDPVAPPMPLFHTTSYFHYQSIINDGTLGQISNPPQLFYGRPAYELKGDREYELENRRYFSVAVASAPVCILFKSGLLNIVKQFFPFDTGGWSKFKHRLSPAAMDDYALVKHPKTPQRAVGCFYSTHSRYYDEHPHDFEYHRTKLGCNCYVELYVTMITDLGEADMRLSSIECVLNTPVALTRNNVHAIVLPDRLNDLPSEKEVVKRTRAIARILWYRFPVKGQTNYHDLRNSMIQRIHTYLTERVSTKLLDA